MRLRQREEKGPAMPEASGGEGARPHGDLGRKKPSPPPREDGGVEAVVVAWAEKGQVLDGVWIWVRIQLGRVGGRRTN